MGRIESAPRSARRTDLDADRGCPEEGLAGRRRCLQRAWIHCFVYFAAMTPTLRWTDCLFQKSLQFGASRGIRVGYCRAEWRFADRVTVGAQDKRADRVAARIRRAQNEGNLMRARSGGARMSLTSCHGPRASASGTAGCEPHPAQPACAPVPARLRRDAARRLDAWVLGTQRPRRESSVVLSGGRWQSLRYSSSDHPCTRPNCAIPLTAARMLEMLPSPLEPG